jgi:catecholate siderophore receptor
VGRGAASGYINLSSKLPSLEDAVYGTAAIDSGETKRLSADLNRKLADGVAFRLNAVGQEGGLMGRKVIEKELYGIAPSIAFGLGTATRVYLYSQHIRQEGKPDGGLPAVGFDGYFSTNTDNAISQALMKAPKVGRDNYYGYASDYEDIEADMGTVKVEHQFGSATTFTNTTRYGKSTMDRILTGVNAINVTAANVNTPAAWTVARTRQSVLQENTILANTSNVVSTFKASGVEHTVSAGLEFMAEEQFAPTRATASLGTASAANLYNPNPNDALTGYAPALSGAWSKGETRTAALYAFDTIKLNDQWQVNGGVRYEHYATESTAATLTNNVLVSSRLKKSDNLFSWKAGALYKPTADGSIYLSYATSQTPPGSANFSLSATAGNVNGPGMDPQKTTNLELGTKWDLIQKKLAVTAALYRTENTNEFTLEDPVAHTYSQLGKRRVQGLELGVVGQITRDWSIIAGLAKMKATILEGTTGNNAAGSDTRWSPDLSATLWSTYNLTRDLKVGGGVRYMSEQQRTVAPGRPLANGAQGIPSYWVADAVVSYKVANNVSIQLNLYNLTDKFYVATLNNGGSRALVGVERSGQLSANFMF